MTGIGLMSMSSMTASLTASLSAFVPASSVIVLEITAGIHRGVRLELEPGDCRIGSTSSADIVLRDAGIAAEHAILRVGRRSIDLHAIGGEVGVGGKVVAKGYGCALRAPIDLTIGEARLRISVERGQAPARRGISTAILIAGALLLAVPALALGRHHAAPTVTGQTSAAQTAPSDETPPVTTASLRQQPNSGSAYNAEDAARKLAEHLDVSGLPGLRVSAAGGQVVVTGSIMKKQTAAWTEAQQWFDEAYRGRLVLVANVTVSEAKPLPVVNVQAVWFGEHPYIITAEGSRYYKGAFLDNGWTIKDIADGRILLTKGGENLALVYRR